MRPLIAASAGGLLLAACAPPATQAPAAAARAASPASGWSALPPAQRTRALTLAEAVREFIARAKTPRLTVRHLEAAARERGFLSLPRRGARFQAGNRYLLPFRGKSLALFFVGQAPLREGLTLHIVPIDAPRIDLKANPVFGREGFLLLKTHLYGALDLKYWLSAPLALHGFVMRGGAGVDVAIGENEDDPVLVIPDLLPHLSSRRQARHVARAEQMDPVVAATMDRAVLSSALAARGLATDDFEHGEWTLVPARPPRLVGADRGLLLGYGQSYRAQALAALRGLSSARTPKRTQALLLVDRSRLGMGGDTADFFLEYALGRLLASASGDVEDLAMARILMRSRAFVATPNGGQLGGGITLNQRFDDGDPALLRAVLDAFARHKVPYQIAEGPGRGSRARRVTRLNVAAMDVTLPAAASDRPLELTSAFDLHAAARAYRALADL
jgi:aspartyl aminopeptidase